MPKTAQPTVADLRQQFRDDVLDVTGYARALNELVQYHATAAAEYGYLDEKSMLASDKRAWQRHTDEFRAAEAALVRLEMDNPDDPAFKVDYRQVINATGNDATGPGPVWSGAGYHTGGGHVYNRGDHRTSWVRDLASASPRRFAETR
ncbi:MAG TPA: hypothetical protein VHH34_24155, partial [Pseudonocardiaceae bacterium]|nr:hypothetical protein [Pseudonocardiaceae bacterium]